MLKSFSLQVWLFEYSYEFLRHQTELKKLIILPTFPRDRNDYTELCEGLHPEALPHLGFLGVEHCMLLDLMKDRPVTGVHIYYSVIDTKILPHVSQKLSQGDFNTILAQFFSAISFCRGSLVKLKLEIYVVYNRTEETEDPMPHVDGVALQGYLAAYSALKSFRLINANELTRDLLLSDSLMAPGLIETKAWKESCPHVKEINIFGYEVVS
ncbi:hypothetical protein RhiJN_16332 [Ceratobasidium sp. AG-Ba]|nr:hypothetical protein RhiJN_16332 [Ceratobasidium sp. AG-Ba]